MSTTIQSPQGSGRRDEAHRLDIARGNIKVTGADTQEVAVSATK